MFKCFEDQISTGWCLLKKLTRILKNLYLDMRFGGKFLGGTVTSEFEGAHDTANTDYAAMPFIFNGRINSTDILVDVGCGKGRVINWWLSQGYQNKIVGIELNPVIAAETRKRLRKYKNVEILTGSVIQNAPKNATIFYLFNPFNKEITSEFKGRIESLYNGNTVTIYYYNCIHVDVFRESPFWEIEEVSTPHHKLAIITKIVNKI